MFTFGTRVGLQLAGSVVLGVAVGLMLWNDFGPGPMDVFIVAVQQLAGIPLMVALWATVAVLVGFAWLLGRRPGVGTALGPLVVGPIIQTMAHALERFDPVSPLVGKAAVHAVAIGLAGVGAGMIIVAGLGAGTGELLAGALADRSGRPESMARLGFEVTMLSVGALLGGPLGVGTMMVALLIGPAVSNGRRFVDAAVLHAPFLFPRTGAVASGAIDRTSDDRVSV